LKKKTARNAGSALIDLVPTHTWNCLRL